MLTFQRIMNSESAVQEHLFKKKILIADTAMISVTCMISAPVKTSASSSAIDILFLQQSHEKDFSQKLKILGSETCLRLQHFIG